MQILEFLDEPVDNIVPGVPLANGQIIGMEEFVEFEPKVSQKILRWISGKSWAVYAGMHLIAIVSTKKPRAEDGPLWHYGENVYGHVDGTKRVLHNNHFTIWLCDETNTVLGLVHVFHDKIAKLPRRNDEAFEKDNVNLLRRIKEQAQQRTRREQELVAEGIKNAEQKLRGFKARQEMLMRLFLETHDFKSFD